LATYRPFDREYVYFDRLFNHERGKTPRYFPTPKHPNLGFYVVGTGSDKPFSTLATAAIPDLALWGSSNGQYFPRYAYEPTDSVGGAQGELDLGADPGNAIVDGYRRIDNITDATLAAYRRAFGQEVTKDDIFYYIYGLLHSPDYREKFAVDLKKALPRLPLVEKPADFWAFSKAGRDLAEFHLNYESYSEPRYDVKITGDTLGDFHVDKMRFLADGDKTGIRYNSHITVTNIPFAAYDYVVNGKSAIEWIIERYQVKTDKDSGIKNDPNDWADEHGKPRYILDLLLSVIAVSVETVRIVEGLPRVEFEECHG
jgi:predicted helicase